MPSLPEVLRGVKTALRAGAGLVPEAELKQLQGLAAEVEQRLGFGGDFLLVALLGGTGSGKSSLLNAIAGKTVAEAGHLRPTTAEPLAWIPTTPDPGLVRLLDEMGVHERVGQNDHPHLAILDMPDVDSMVGAHRETVEALLSRIDVVIWVTDPEKYNDRTLHHDFIRPLASYAEQFLFVLNQTDRLEPAQRNDLVRDLVDRLEAEGIKEPKVLPIAADPDIGAPIGIASLVDQLRSEFSGKQLMLSKLRIDLTGIADRLGEFVTPGSKPLVDGWGQARDETVRELLDLVAGGDYQEILEGAGRVKASITTSGPIGLVVNVLKRNPITRALGVRVADELIDDASARWASRTGIEAAIAPLSAVLSNAGTGASGILDHRIRALGNEVETSLRASVDAARRQVGGSAQLHIPFWWRLVAAVKWLAALSVVAGTVWLFADPTQLQPGAWSIPLLMVGGGLLTGLLAWWIGRAGGARAGRKSVERFRGELSDELRRQLDNRLGSRIRSLEEERDSLTRAIEQVQRDLAAGLDEDA